ncbi:type II toxin-antitoxin system RelE family toxin (plasmid) [Latilactobacillus sakei]
MSYRVSFTKKARKQLKKLDPTVAKAIFHWIDKNLENCDNPRTHGKGLTSNRSSEWRYRFGKYRIIAQIIDDELIINVIKIGLRNSVYDEKR